MVRILRPSYLRVATTFCRRAIFKTRVERHSVSKCLKGCFCDDGRIVMIRDVADLMPALRISANLVTPVLWDGYWVLWFRR